jgi:hypothetical protein
MNMPEPVSEVNEYDGNAAVPSAFRIDPVTVNVGTLDIVTVPSEAVSDIIVRECTESATIARFGPLLCLPFIDDPCMKDIYYI